MSTSERCSKVLCFLYLMVSHTASSRALASTILCLITPSHLRDSNTWPTIWFRPTSMHPRVSSAVFLRPSGSKRPSVERPAWMRMPLKRRLKSGPPRSKGSHCLNFGLHVMTTAYRPSGMAKGFKLWAFVGDRSTASFDTVVFSSRAVGSSVSQR